MAFEACLVQEFLNHQTKRIMAPIQEKVWQSAGISMGEITYSRFAPLKIIRNGMLFLMRIPWDRLNGREGLVETVSQT